MGDTDDRSLVLLQMLLEPIDTFGIKVVGRFVKEQDVGLLQQQAAECHTAPLTTGKVCTGRLGSRTTQGGHRTLQTVVEIPRVGGIDDILELGQAVETLLHSVCILVVFWQG